MNYKKNYYDYIDYVKTLNRYKGDGKYYEKHHIKPRSLGGDDSEDNLVLLTAREHYLAHYLLWKFNPCMETAFAFHAMMDMKNNKVNRDYKVFSSRIYQELRVQCSRYISEINKGNKVWLGKHHSEKTKKKISEAHKGKKLSEESKNKDRLANLGRKHSEETKRKISENNKGKHFMSDEHKNKIRLANLGKHHSEETRKKMSAIRKGAVFTDEHKLHLSESAKKRVYSEETRKKMSESAKKRPITKGSKGMSWFNNGVINKMAYECPEGFVKGKLKKVLQQKVLKMQ